MSISPEAKPADPPADATGPLAGLKVLDLSRVLAGPSATQLLGDLGADVIKVERPSEGDDTRKWGPPFLKDDTDSDTTESAYYLSTNRNKRSVTIDFTKPEGSDLLVRLSRTADVLIENFKVGTLYKHGLAYETLSKANPRLIWCAITGFGQTGPYADRPGYDFLIQGMGGLMSLTGPADGAPQRTGVAIADIMAGMYATVAILAALRHRDITGQGQFIDLALLDTQVAWLSYSAQHYLISGEVPPRLGNAHPNIVPYQAFATADGFVVLGIGNDRQFARFAACVDRPDWAADPRFAANQGRVRNRALLVPDIATIMAKRSSSDWISELEREGIPCSPINRVDQVFADPQVVARGMVTTLPHTQTSKPVPLISNPLRFSETPVSYRHAPPTLGQHTHEVLKSWLDLDQAALGRLVQRGVI